MNKKILIPWLLVTALLSVVYAVYRSTSQTITVVENGNQTVYGEPQHGLILGLFILAATCIIGTILLMLDKPSDVVHHTPEPNTSTLTKRPF